ncbi:MAG: MarR family transcriptional regulator, partial [Anaeroplasmataceae bacterium]|nr:MarR family transcriptional regulator [Anaeroplasmataceae bacterium]
MIKENPVIEIVPYLKLINDKVKLKIDSLLHKTNITLSQSMCILLLLTMGGKTKQKELQNLLKVSHSAMVRMIQRLEEKQFVKSIVDG